MKEFKATGERLGDPFPEELCYEAWKLVVDEDAPIGHDLDKAPREKVWEAISLYQAAALLAKKPTPSVIVNIARFYERLANIDFPAVEDEENFVPENTQARHCMEIGIKLSKKLLSQCEPPDPEIDVAYLVIGTLLCRIGRYKDAVSYLENARRLISFDKEEDHDIYNRILKNLDFIKRKSR